MPKLAPSEVKKCKSQALRDSKPSAADEEMVKHNAALSEIGRRLQRGVEENEQRALCWARLLDAALDFKSHWTEREVRLRLLYLRLYALQASAALPEVPSKLAKLQENASVAELRIMSNVESLRITLTEALAQVNTQRHPGAYFLLSCHLGKERPPACQSFPWLTLGALLLIVGLLCGPSDRSGDVVSVAASSGRSGSAAAVGAADRASAGPVAMGVSVMALTFHLSQCRGGCHWLTMLALGLAATLLCPAGLQPSGGLGSWGLQGISGNCVPRPGRPPVRCTMSRANGNG